MRPLLGVGCAAAANPSRGAGAAAAGGGGGFGDLGIYTTTLLGSSDVTHLVIQLLPPDLRIAEFGHGDLFQAADAETLAWAPLLAWLEAH